MGESSPLPERIGDYHVLGKLGEGGMGSVLMATAPDGRLVAVKVVRDPHAGRPEFRARFRREAEAASRVPRFCTAEVLDFEVDGEDAPYIVTEYVEGPTLQASVRDGGPWSPSDLEQLGVTVAAALTAIHNAGVVHGDLKPGNVLLSHLGPRVIDFGIARAYAPVTGGEEDAPAEPPAGTPEFMAPEQFEGKDATSAADVFAWGGLMVFAATARYPFGTGTLEEVGERIVNADPDLSGLDERLRGVVAAALANDPAERPDSQELLDLLGEDDADAGPPAAANGRLAGLPPATTAASDDSDPSGSSAANSSATSSDPSGSSESGEPAAAAVAALEGDGPATAEMPPVQELRVSRPVNRPAERPATGVAGPPSPPPPDPDTAPGGRRRLPLNRTAWVLIAAGVVIIVAAGVLTWVSDTVADSTEAVGSPTAVDAEATQVERFNITIGEWVASGQPGPGAGELAAGGEQEVYAFDGLKGQKLYLSGCSCEPSVDSASFAPAWSLTDPSGQTIERGNLCDTPTKRDQELPMLPANGRYRLVFDTDSDTGQYSFELSAPQEMPESPDEPDEPGEPDASGDRA